MLRRAAELQSGSVKKTPYHFRLNPWGGNFSRALEEKDMGMTTSVGMISRMPTMTPKIFRPNGIFLVMACLP
jgi:hypothetical protein